MEGKGNYPHEIKHLSSEETAEILKCFSESPHDSFIQIGIKEYFFGQSFQEQAESFYNLPLRKDDIFVVTFPKSGTTWTQELVWMLVHNFDYERAKIPLLSRFPFLEGSFILRGEKSKAALIAQCGNDPKKLAMLEEGIKLGCTLAAECPSPRLLKSHLPLSLLPPTLLDTAKVVYVARDPRDVAVSFYHHHKLFKLGSNTDFSCEFKDFWYYFKKNMLDWTPFFSHVKEAWEQRNHPNMLFLFYEDLLDDLPAAVRQVAKFLGKDMTEDQLSTLCEHLSFKNFKNNVSVNFEIMREFGWLAENQSFVRKGKAGGWRNYFDEDMARGAQQWIDENLRDTDLRFRQKE